MAFTDATQPSDGTQIAQGASWIRALKAALNTFFAVSFNDDGSLKASAVPNGLPSPYGAAGTVLQSAGAGVTPVWVVISTTVPTGGVIDFAGALPTGYLECDGSVLNIADHPALAAVVGTTFGGDGVTTFGVTDCRGRATVGLGTGDAPDATAWTLGRKAGEETHTLTEAELAVHAHELTDIAKYSGQHQNGTQPAGVYPYVSGSGNTAGVDAGSGDAHNNLQPSLGLRKVIKT